MLGGQCVGGSNFNVVPESCSFTIDRRINPEEDLAAEKQRIVDVLEACQRDGISLVWEVFQEGRSAFSAEDASLAQALAANIRAVTGHAAQFQMCPGLLEIRFYAPAMPAYAFGPGLLSVAHGPNEYIDLRKLVESATIYALTAIEVLSH